MGDRSSSTRTPSKRLPTIIGVLNNRFGVGHTETDQLFFEQVQAEVHDHPRAKAVALNNDLDQFRTVFDDMLEGIMIDRHSANDELLGAFLDKPDFRNTLAQMIGREVYKTIRASGESA